ncbi:unnamed protein product [Prunus armeniaca]|uniref:hAT-like transposase RNase-H fold domain-containing protein n=1 Tax=Prunus armeniaca TaxID=36596 RepID=A0A6J5VK00_PRUAR|nr:unnamed protein product [Prunus armeniaca]
MSAKFDPNKFRELLVMTIIKHELPFQFVEFARIRDVFNYICADIKLISQNIAKVDVLSLYNRENGKLKELLGSITGRVCLTSDLLYGTNSQEMAKVHDMLCSLFDLYMQIHSKSESIDGTLSTSSGVRSHVDDIVSKECMNVMKEFDTFESEESITSSQKSQLQLYLDEPKVDRMNLNVLDFGRPTNFDIMNYLFWLVMYYLFQYLQSHLWHHLVLVLECLINIIVLSNLKMLRLNI